MNDNYAGENMGGGDYTEEINWDEVGNPPPIGDYNFSIEKAEYKPTGKGKHMVKCQMKIEAAVDAANESAIGRTVFTNFNFFQAGAFGVKAFCKALDIPLPLQVNKAVLGEWINEHLVTGLVFGARILHRPWNDAMQADVVKFCAAYEIGGAALDTSGAEGGDAEGETETEPEAETEADDAEDVVEEEAPPPPAPTRSLRTAAPAAAPKSAKANGVTNGTNGHANGKTAAAPAGKPAKKNTAQASR
jgi:hypothetical protein